MGSCPLCLSVVQVNSHPERSEGSWLGFNPVQITANTTLHGLGSLLFYFMNPYQLAYFTEHPYGRVVGVPTGLPARACSSARLT